MSETIYARRAQLMEAELGEDLVALDAEAGTCFGFNSVAASVWRLLATPQTFGDLERALLTEYDVDAEECRADLRQLIGDMTAKGLIGSRPPAATDRLPAS